MPETSIFYGKCNLPTPTTPYRGCPITPNNNPHQVYNKGLVNFSHIDECENEETRGLPAKELFIHGFVRVEILSRQALEQELEYVEALKELDLKRVDFEKVNFERVQTLYTQIINHNDRSNQTLNRGYLPIHHVIHIKNTPMTFYLYEASGETLKRAEKTIEQVLAQTTLPPSPVIPNHIPPTPTSADETSSLKKDPTLEADNVLDPKAKNHR